LPIVGDRTYGDFRANREYVRSGGPKRMFLHSLSIAFDYEWGARLSAFSAEAPLPPEFGLPV
jgi:23S rRNA-/tRNA-specific pseudouridylate synthase